jgi:LuxR family maltose regulon positive regulatory protein
MPANTIKFHPPEAPVNSLPRSALVLKLHEQARSKLAIIHAPAGYGKTTLMGQYYNDLKQRGKIVAWLSLDKSDNDVVTFINLVVESCNYARAGSMPANSEILASKPEVNSEGFWQWAISAFDDSNMPDYLFIDEFEFINDATILEMISSAMNRLPGHRQVVIGSRKLPELSYSRLQLNNEVTVLSLEDLKFDSNECKHFLLDNSRADISCGDIDSIRAETDGWPAALQIGKLLLDRSSNVAKAIKQLGQEQLFSDYIVENILAGETRETREFLFATCILDDLDPAVCQHLSGMENAGDILARLTSNGLFTQRRAQSEQYRYHSLFSGTLRQLLATDQPDQLRKQHCKAGEWLLAHQQPWRAAEHAMAGGDTAVAAGIVEEAALEAVFSSQLAPVLNWAASIPEELKATLPNLQLACAWAHLLSRNSEAANEALGNLELTVEQGGAAPEILFRAMPVAMINRQLMDQFEGMEEAIENYLVDLPGEAVFERLGLNNVLNYVHLTRNRFESARSIALAVQATTPTNRSRYTLSYSHTLLAMQQVIQGQLLQARLTLEAARELTDSDEITNSVARAVPIPVLAELLYEENRTEEAKALLERAMPFIRSQAVSDHLISAFCNLSRIYALENQHHLAFKILEDLERQGYSDGLPRIVATARCELARLHQMQGNLQQAVDIYQSIEVEGLSTSIAQHRFHPADIEADDITLIRLLLGRNELPEARRLAEQALADTHPQRIYRRLKLQIMSSLVFQAQADVPAACECLLQVIQSSLQEPFVRIFLDEGEPLVALLLQLKKTIHTSAPVKNKNTVLARIDDLLSQSATSPSTPADPDQRELVEPLTKRELEMLQMIADGNSNKEIANSLHVTEGTVKWHLVNIYSKMAVKRRSQAVASGRQLGIIH